MNGLRVNYIAEAHVLLGLDLIELRVAQIRGNTRQSYVSKAALKRGQNCRLHINSLLSVWHGNLGVLLGASAASLAECLMQIIVVLRQVLLESQLLFAVLELHGQVLHAIFVFPNALLAHAHVEALRHLAAHSLARIFSLQADVHLGSRSHRGACLTLDRELVTSIEVGLEVSPLEQIVFLLALVSALNHLFLTFVGMSGECTPLYLNGAVGAINRLLLAHIVMICQVLS